MNRLLSIFFLVIQGSNIFGSFLFFLFAVYQTNHFYESQSGKGFYNKNELVEVKIPVSLPGITDWTAYEPISGQIQFQDVTYNYTQMRVTSHALYLKCVPNYTHTRLIHQNVIRALHIKDMPVSKKDHVPYGIMVILPCPDIALYNPLPATISSVVQKSYRFYSQKPVTVCVQIPEQPPKFS